MKPMKPEVSCRYLTCRALKCDGGQGSIHCDELPMIENFVAVARSLQRSKGIPDSEFRVFVGADKRESYDKVGSSCCPNSSTFDQWAESISWPQQRQQLIDH